MLVGAVQIEDLFLGHDIQVRATRGHYTGSATPAPDGDQDGRGTLRIDTDYWEGHALALNKWRIKYGLAYAVYELPATVHTFFADAGQRAYSYTGSFFRNVTFHDIHLLVGYSTLDYVARYENHYSELILDGDFLIGASFMSFESVPAGGGSATSGGGLALGTHLDLGWLWLTRSRDLSGFGIYVRPVYRGEFGLTVAGGRPSNRNSDETDEASASAGARLVSYRHGPWLDVGLIW